MQYKIGIESADGANLQIAKSYATALAGANHQVFWYDPAGKSPFDFFVEVGELDLWIGHTWKLNRAIVKNLISRPNMKVVMFGDHFGRVDSEIDLQKYPIGIATDEQKFLVEEVRKACPNFTYVLCQYHNKYVEETHGRWVELGVSPHGIMLSANINEYFPVPPQDDYRVNVVFAGGTWAYKQINLDQYITPLTYPNTNWSVRIFGPGWNVVNGLGIASVESLRNYYASAGICPNVFEPHSITYGCDVNQRSYEVAVCGGFQISQRVRSLQEDVFTDGEIIFVDSPEEFFSQCVHFLNNPEETVSYRQKSIQTVFRGHTNYHRAKYLLDLLGMDSIAISDRIIQLQKQYLGEYGESL